MMGFSIPNFIAERFTWAYENCKKHATCEDCELVGGKAIVIGEGQEQSSIVCENGINKGVVNSND